MGHFYSATTKNISTAHWYIIAPPFSMTGLVAGLVVTLTMIAFDWSRVSGIHSGIIGLIVNMGICLLGMVKNKPFIRE
ncbi:MAG: hypothetical protein HOK41_08160 [Nitrospina sp.]|nr:hypothetical protein [Nitrospina sp.]MBT6717730.1 hypothetical protein [Nitrospina sp.]